MNTEAQEQENEMQPTPENAPLVDYVVSTEYDGGKVVKVVRLAVTMPPAELAQELIARWGMVAAVEDGEDRAGRSKFRLQTGDELVTRACETAEKFFAEIKRRGWILRLPKPIEGNRERFDNMSDLKARARDLRRKMDQATSGAPLAQSEQVKE